MRFYTNGLLSKYGFCDGDLLDDLQTEEELEKIDGHKLLAAILFDYVIPVLDQKVEVVVIGTIHNPVRVSTVDDMDVEKLWLGLRDETGILTPEYVDVDNNIIREKIESGKFNENSKRTN